MTGCDCAFSHQSLTRGETSIFYRGPASVEAPRHQKARPPADILISL